jgi:hypothetical protein
MPVGADWLEPSDAARAQDYGWPAISRSLGSLLGMRRIGEVCVQRPNDADDTISVCIGHGQISDPLIRRWIGSQRQASRMDEGIAARSRSSAGFCRNGQIY